MELAQLENENCRETVATIHLSAASLDPEELTRIIGRQPTWSYRPESSQPGRWSLSTSEAGLTTTSAERHIVWLLEQVERSYPALQVAFPDVEAEFVCGWFAKQGANGGGPMFSVDLIERLAGIHAALSCDFYHGE